MTSCICQRCRPRDQDCGLKTAILRCWSRQFSTPINNLLACMSHKITILFAQVHNKDCNVYLIIGLSVCLVKGVAYGERPSNNRASTVNCNRLVMVVLRRSWNFWLLLWAMCIWLMFRLPVLVLKELGLGLERAGLGPGTAGLDYETGICNGFRELA